MNENAGSSMRQWCYAALGLLLLTGCQYKVICPTFQSTFILDDSVRTTYFSYLWYLEDGERDEYLLSKSKIPPTDSAGVLVASASEDPIDYFSYTEEYKVNPYQPKKNKFGMIKRAPYPIRLWQLKKSPMQNVLTPPGAGIPEPDTRDDYLDSLIAISDSAMVDSLNQVMAKREEQQNQRALFLYDFDDYQWDMQPDQKLYFDKFGYLLQNTVPEPQLIDSSDSIAIDSATTKKPFFKGRFRDTFKNLFKKKDKTTPDEAPESADFMPPEDEAIREDEPSEGG